MAYKGTGPYLKDALARRYLVQRRNDHGPLSGRVAAQSLCLGQSPAAGSIHLWAQAQLTAVEDNPVGFLVLHVMQSREENCNWKYGMVALKESAVKGWKSFSLFLHEFCLRNPRQNPSVNAIHRC